MSNGIVDTQSKCEMSLIRTVWRCTFSPRLFKIYKITCTGRIVDNSYKPKCLERWCDQIVVSVAAMWSIKLYALPILGFFLYKYSTSLVENVYSTSKLVAGAGAILIASLAARGTLKANNPVYLKFLQALHKAHAQYNSETKQELHKYDFEFWAAPVDFRVSNTNRNKDKLTLRKIASTSGRIKRQSGKEFIFALPCKLLSYIVAHVLAIRMIYPGCELLVNLTLWSTLIKGRLDLIMQGGERFKLVTADNNEIDAMFIDQRNKSLNGNVLVVTCEGNCGFYETGIMLTPLGKGYSVLGWNHPGFGGSTGSPYPPQEENAIDCVMQFAIEHLKFPENQIILYGWSIGGYTATWAAMNYPSIQSLVLDATFDDVLPLAITTMPASLEGLVRNIIRDYFNLNIAEQLNRYNGNVLLIRRTEDEIVCIPRNTLSGNRGNMLLMKLLLRRYPQLFLENSESTTLLTKFLSSDTAKRSKILEAVKMNEKKCLHLIAKNIRDNNGVVEYPSNIGQDCDLATKQMLLLFFATMYMKDQPTSHCVPLAIDLFQPAWDPVTSSTL